MVGVFGGGMAVHLSPKGLGLSARISEIIFGQSKRDLWIVLGSFGTNWWAVDWPMCAVFLLLLKMNNMLVVCEFC